MLKERVRPVKQVKLRTHNASGSVLEGIFARGDRRLADALELAWQNGARFDSWDEHLDLDRWRAAFDALGIDTAPYLRTLPVTAPLPWSHIDVGLEDGFLLGEYRRALQDRLSPPCGKVAGAFIHHTNLEDANADQRKLVCYDCGVACDMTQMRRERLVYLESLGATKRPPRAEPDEPEDETAVPVAHADRKRKHGPKVGDPTAGHRYRICFHKKGPAALLGHLDLVRELPRIFRRVDVRPVYTGGYNPRPAMTFTPALSLGVSALGEHVDVRLEPQFDPGELEKLIMAMNANSPTGLDFRAGVRLPREAPSLSKQVVAARYVLLFSRAVVHGHAGERAPAIWLAERCAALMAAPELVLWRKVKGIGKKLDVRPRIAALTVIDAEAVAREAMIAGDLLAIAAEVSLTARGSVKTSELARLLFESDEPPPHHAVRLRLLAADPSESLLSLSPGTAGGDQDAPLQDAS